MRIGRSRSSKVVDFGTNRKGVCDFLLVINSNFGPILHRFLDMATYWLKIANFSYPTRLTPSLGVNPFEFLGECFIRKSRVLGLSVGEDCDPSLRCFHTVSACDGRTDGRTDIPIVASTGLAAMLTTCKDGPVFLAHPVD